MWWVAVVSVACPAGAGLGAAVRTAARPSCSLSLSLEAPAGLCQRASTFLHTREPACLSINACVLFCMGQRHLLHVFPSVCMWQSSVGGQLE